MTETSRRSFYTLQGQLVERLKNKPPGAYWRVYGIFSLIVCNCSYVTSDVFTHGHCVGGSHRLLGRISGNLWWNQEILPVVNSDVADNSDCDQWICFPKHTGTLRESEVMEKLSAKRVSWSNIDKICAYFRPALKVKAKAL